MKAPWAMVRCTDSCSSCITGASSSWADLFDETRDGVQVWTICCHTCGRTIRDATAAELRDAAQTLREKARWLIDAAKAMSREEKTS